MNFKPVFGSPGDCRGHLMRRGWAAYDAADKLIGTFESEDAATAAILIGKGKPAHMSSDTRAGW
jgi:hypothetical protein